MNQRWESQLKQLQEYKIQNGHCNISISDNNNNNIELAKWTAEQCKYYKLYELNLPNPLSKERYIKLKEMNLLGGNLWEARLMELRAYKAEHGHTDVPIDYPKLGIWVMNQRDTYAFNKEDMGEHRIAALNAISFNWNRWGRKRRKGREDAWELQYTNLLAYIKEHGNSNISQHDKNHEKLGKWIKNQRYEYKKYNNPDLGPSRLSRDRIEKLNDCGFQWRLRPDRVPWEERYKALVQYKAVNGHTNVELGHELRKWVQYQREN